MIIIQNKNHQEKEEAGRQCPVSSFIVLILLNRTLLRIFFATMLFLTSFEYGPLTIDLVTIYLQEALVEFLVGGVLEVDLALAIRTLLCH